MTIWSIPLRGIRGKKPRNHLTDQIDHIMGKKRTYWKKEYIHDTRPIIDGNILGKIEIPYHPGMAIVHYEYKGEGFESKLTHKHSFQHMMPHLETIFSEIVIDDSYWKFPYMPDYPDHNDFEKYQTVVMQSTCLMTALKLIDYNRFFAPFSLKNSTLNDLENAEESSVEFILNHPFQIPMATFSKGRSKSRITSKEIEWVGNAMTTMNKLFFNDDFTTTMEAMSYYYGDLPVRAKMMLIWSAIEDLLRPKKSIRYGVKKRFAMILGKTDEERKELHDLVDSLYQKRNSATHGRKFAWVHGVEDIFENNELQLDLSTLIYSYQLLCDLFYQIVDNGRRYTDDELIRMDEEYEEKFPNKRSKS